MFQFDKAKVKALIELLKSTGRAVYFTILGVIAAALVAVSVSPEVLVMTVTVAGFTFNVGTIIAAGIAFLAKAVDTYVRKNTNIDANGIAPGFLQR